MVRFNISYPWREPESTWFQIWSSVGAHPPTQQHEHREQKTLGVTFKHPAKYCSWSRLHIQHRPFKHYLRSYSILVMTVAPTCSFNVWFLISYAHTSAHLNYTFKQRHCVCTVLKWVWFSPFTVSQHAAVFVPHMVSLQGPKPQAGRTKCQLSLNAVTFLIQLCFFTFLL